MAYAKSKGLKVGEKPTPMGDLEKKSMAAHMALMEKLKSAKGAAFDACYVSNQVADHDDTHAKVMAMMQAGGTGADAEMSAMLNELHQKLPQHREHAYQVLGKLDDKLMQGMGGAGASGSTTTQGSGGTTGGTMGKSDAGTMKSDAGSMHGGH
jgi:putative membrane protein